MADGCGNVLAMLHGMRAMSLVAHPRSLLMSLKDKCKQRSRPPKDKGNHRSRRSAGHQAAAPEGGREKRRDRRDLWLCVYISGSMQAIG